jgi:DNA-binding response OmpR family regulator
VKTNRILVVDDDATVRELLRVILEKEGYVVTEAADGKEAIRVFRRKPADLIVTDIIMPEQEGLKTIFDLRREHPRTKIIAISGGGQYGLTDYLEAATAFGADRTFAKPFDRGELVKAVRQLLSQQRPNPAG